MEIRKKQLTIQMLFYKKTILVMTKKIYRPLLRMKIFCYLIFLITKFILEKKIKAVYKFQTKTLNLKNKSKLYKQQSKREKIILEVNQDQLWFLKMISNNYKKFLFLENPLKEFSDKIKMNNQKHMLVKIIGSILKTQDI